MGLLYSDLDTCVQMRYIVLSTKPEGSVTSTRKRFEVDEATGCWVWLRSLNTNGYGLMTVHKKTQLAHRFIYELVKGRIPEGMVLDHLCCNKLCVNPAHMEVVSREENSRRGGLLKRKLTTAVVNAIKDHLLQHPQLSHLEVAAHFKLSVSSIRRALGE